MTFLALIPTIGALDFGDWLGVIVLVGFVLVGAVKAKNEKDKQADADHARHTRAAERASGEIPTERLPTRNTERFANAQALAKSVREELRPKAANPYKPTPPRVATKPRPSNSRPAEARVRRKGLVDDAHVEVGSKLPTSDDMPGAHSAHDHVHLTEIGADRGTSEKHIGAHPTAAATVVGRRAISGRDLLRSSDLRGKDRVRAGILWAEVFGPPRSRSRR